MARTDPRPNYGLGRRVRVDGYIDLWRPGHPLSRSDGYVFEHRLMAWEAGLLVCLTDEVHHVNEIKTDNRLENFEIKSPADHARDHAEQRGTATNQFGTFAVKPREQRQSAPKVATSCSYCGAPVPATLRRDAQYCSPRCRVTAWKHAQRGAAA